MVQGHEIPASDAPAAFLLELPGQSRPRAGEKALVDEPTDRFLLLRHGGLPLFGGIDGHHRSTAENSRFTGAGHRVSSPGSLSVTSSEEQSHHGGHAHTGGPLGTVGAGLFRPGGAGDVQVDPGSLAGELLEEHPSGDGTG